MIFRPYRRHGHRGKARWGPRLGPRVAFKRRYAGPESVASIDEALTQDETTYSTAASSSSEAANATLNATQKEPDATNDAPYPDHKSQRTEESETSEIYVQAFAPGKSPHPSPYISYNSPYPEACARHIDQTFHAKRVYILVSATLSRQTNDLPRLHNAIDERLADPNRLDAVVGIRRGIRPHTRYSDILQIVSENQHANVDCIVTLGGGSLTDAAKVVALVSDNPSFRILLTVHAAKKPQALANRATTLNELESLYFDSPTLREPLLPATIPIICIPTTLSAGEYTPIAGATNDATKRKHSFQHLSMGPRLVILSPELTTTTPAHVWLSTGIRAVDHCIESICSIKASTEGDAIAEKGLRRLLPGLLLTKANPEELSSRLACQLGAVDAISAPLNRVPVGASHGIGHQLGPLRVGHGETSCVLLPAVCQYNKRVNSKQQRQVLKILWSEGAVADVLRSAGLEKESADLSAALKSFFKALEMPTSLQEVGVTRDQFDALAERSLDDRCCKTNPVPLKRKEQVLEILEICAGDASTKSADAQTFTE